MKAILLVTEDSSVKEEVDSLLGVNHVLIDTASDSRSWAMLNGLAVGLVIVDTDMPAAKQWLSEAESMKPEMVYIGLGREEKRAMQLSGLLYDHLRRPIEPWLFGKALERGWDKLKQNRLAGRPLHGGDEIVGSDLSAQPSPVSQGLPSGYWERVLSDFSRALNNRLNKERFIGLFLEAVKELVPAGKMAVLLKIQGSGDYYVAEQRGLDPELQSKLLFKSSDGLVKWLLEKGRILNMATLQPGGDDGYEVIASEMKLLKAVVCVPLIAHGSMVGALCLGPKVVGTPFYERELQLLYTICGNVAMALEDIDLHEKLYNQNVYIESILQLMHSGVAAIDGKERIITFNDSAARILTLDRQKILGMDLRVLPSPLGDMLYETLTTGKAYMREETMLPAGRLPLELSTYRITGANGEIFGSVMIFDNITFRKEAELKRRQAEQSEVLNRFVGQLTHEIKNPMVAIQTFCQLLPDKYEDSTFREFFSQTVKQELKRLNELVDQLIAFSSPLNYRYDVTDALSLIDEAIGLLHEQGKGLDVPVKKYFYRHNPRVRIDRLNMSRAISYLLGYLLENVESKEGLFVNMQADSENGEGEKVNILLSNDSLKVKAEKLESLFNPLELKPDNSICLGLPVSKKIIEDHGGSLKVAGKNSDSVMFKVALPVFVERRTDRGGVHHVRQT